MPYKHLLLLFSYTFFYISGVAQVDEKFTDGNFSHQPTWVGDTGFFEIDSLRLRSDGQASSDTIALATANQLIDSIRWEFWIKLDFQPSASNRLRIYLVSNQVDLKSALKGYFLEVGATGSPDSIYFYRQDSFQVTKIGTGTKACFSGSSNNKVRIRVFRSRLGEWTILSDCEGGENFTPEGVFTDSTYHSTSYIGFWCKHSSSRKDKFYFDDIYTGLIPQDTFPPAPDTLEVISANRLQLKFSEPLSLPEAEVVQNYYLSPSIGQPDSVERSAVDSSMVTIYLPQAMVNGNTYQLKVHSLKDTIGNTMPDTAQWMFQYLFFASPHKGEVLINEIFPDGTPSQSLPEAEFVELYNKTSDKYFNLNLWKWEDAGSRTVLSDYILAPQQYVLLYDSRDSALWQSYPNAMAVADWPALNNSGDSLRLLDIMGNTIDYVPYQIGWHEPEKQNGGWSLERQDRNYSCHNALNWHSCKDFNGGTPGRENSENKPFEDSEPPQVVAVQILDPVLISLRFDEAVAENTLGDKLRYSINQGIGTPLAASIVGYTQNKVDLLLPVPLDSQQLYCMLIDSLADCSGNIALTTEVCFGIPEKPEPGDILLNEVLFNPYSGGSDFVEIYNYSTKVIDLKDLYIGKIDPEDGLLSDWFRVSGTSSLLLPHSYLCISEDVKAQQRVYLPPTYARLFEVEGLPSMPDDEGNVVLFTEGNKVLDQYFYHKDKHFPDLDEDEGVSLERISWEAAASDPNNWHSAASTFRYATPGYRNSQMAEPKASDQEVWLSKTIFSPDGDGFEDILTVNYHFTEQGNTIRATVFDFSGNQIKRIQENTLIGGTKGKLFWDGVTLNNRKAPVGIYLLLFETSNPNIGETKFYRLPFIVAAKLN